MKDTLEQSLRKARRLAREGSIDTAEAIYQALLARFPARKDVQREYETLLAAHIENPPAPDLEMIVTLFRMGRHAEARERAALLTARFPRGEILHNIAGAISAALGRLEEAIALYDRAVLLAPDYYEAHNNRGNALKDAGRTTDALAAYDAAIHLNPMLAEAHVNRGILCRIAGRIDDAVASYQHAIRLNPTTALAHENLGNALLDLGRMDDAVTSYETAIGLLAHDRVAQSRILHRLAHMCRWSAVTETANEALAVADGAALPPFHLLPVTDDPARQLQCAKGWSEALYGHGLSAPASTAAPHEQIRLGYFSSDFHNHATMNLIGRMLELHDRARFEVHAFSFGATTHEGVRQRLLGSVDHYHDVSSLTDDAIAAHARTLGIDIAIDLKGHTANARPGIFACRAAPHQVSYLGYPGTMGAPFIDHIIADRIVIPEDQRTHYSEKVLYLPHCYQVNDDQRPISDGALTRADMGLPEQGFIFCSFNDNYKIAPDIFDIWMCLLAKVDGSVLWLLAANPWAPVHLRREAARRGIDPARLVFAEKMPMADHLARHRCANLFLDTFKVNAHTTASDALWAGLPLITLPGRSFAARVAASLLHAIGLPELIAETAADYEALALTLATDPARLADIRQRLAANRLTSPLFDTDRFTRDIEAIYTRLCRPVRAAHPLLAMG